MRNKRFLWIPLLFWISYPSYALEFPSGFTHVDQTYGDFDGGVYHDGIDLPGNLSQEVKSPISSGTIQYFSPPEYAPDKGYVCVIDDASKIWAFGHIQPDPGLYEGKPVDLTTTLGKLQKFPSDAGGIKKEYDHLHITRSINSNRYCKLGGIEDPLRLFTPSITSQSLGLESSGILFAPNDKTGDVASLVSMFAIYNDQKVIWGDADIIVFGRNNINGGNKSGFFRIDYKIQKPLGITAVTERTAFTMSGAMEPNYWLHPYIYLSPPSEENDTDKDWDNYYNITNSGARLLGINENFTELYSNAQYHSWQTQIADYVGGRRLDDDDTQNCPTGQAECQRGSLKLTDNDSLALVNTTSSRDFGARYPDGNYRVSVKAYTYPLEGIPSRATPYVDRDVIVDNFRPYVEQVTATEGAETIYDRKWSLSSGEGKLLSLKPDTEEFLENGHTYDIQATFSEYMDEASVGGMGSDLDDNHTIHKSTLATTLEITGYTADALRPLEFKGKDLAGNYILTISPDKAFITPALELTRDAAGDMQGTGGNDKPDTFHALRIEAGPPVVEYQGRNQILSNTCRSACGTDEEPINLVWNLVRFRYKDIGAGIQNVTIQKKTDAGLELVRTIAYDRHIYEQDLELTLADGQYVVTFTDYSGNPYKTVLHFRVDPDSPRLELLGINMSGDFTNYTAYGVVQDTASGMDFLRLHNTDTLIKDFAIADDGRAKLNFTSPALLVGRENYHVFSAQDKAGNGSYPQPILQFDTLPPGEVGPGQTNLVANYITGVYASGEPCTINITSQRYNSPIPINYTLPQGDSISASLTAVAIEPVQVATPDKFIHGNVSVNVPEQVCQVINGENVCRDACTVSLTGRSIIPLINGPALSYTRNQSAPDNGVKFRFGWYEITFFDLSAAATNQLIIENVGSQAKPDGYVAYPLGTTGALRIKYEGAEYSAIEFKVCGMTGAAAGMKVLHYKDNGETEQLPNLSEGDCVTAKSTTNSIFSVIAPIGMFDKLGPRVDVEAEHLFADNGILYVSSAAPVGLKASDLSADMVNALAGVATTYYLLGIEPTPVCLGTTYEPTAAAGTCQNPVYGGQFAVREGLQNLYYRAVDKVGNIGDPWVTLLAVDGTAPQAEVRLNGAAIAGGTTVYAATADTFTVSAFDPESNGVMSGLATTYFLVNVSTEECSYGWETGGVNGMGSCENNFYTGPFNLPEGTHTVYYVARDNVGNMGEMRTAYITVGNGDVTPPVTVLDVAGEKYQAADVLYMNTRASVTLAAYDPEIAGGFTSGVGTVYYLVDADTGAAAAVYSGPFGLGEGRHAVRYRAVDEAGNYELWQTSAVYADATAPFAFYSVAGVMFDLDGYKYVLAGATLAVGAVDAGAGVKELHWRQDGGPATVAGSSYSAVGFGEGAHSLAYYAADNVGNVAPEQVFSYRVDSTPPVTDLNVSGSSFTAGGKLYLTSGSRLFLAAADPVSNGVNSGVDGTWYSLDGAPDFPYVSAPLSFAEGPHTLAYFSGDRAGNMEGQRTSWFTVDDTPPSVALGAGRALYSESNTWYATSRDTFTFNVTDLYSGVSRARLSVNGGAFADAAGGASLNFTAEGTNKVLVEAADNLGNAAGATYYLVIDDTPPDFSGAKTIKWEAEDPSDVIAPAGSLVVGDGGLKLYNGVSASTAQYTVLYTADTLPSLSTPAWNSYINPNSAGLFERVEGGVLKVGGSTGGGSGGGVYYWRPEAAFAPEYGWSYEMRSRVTSGDSDNSVGLWIEENDSVASFFQFRYSYIWFRTRYHQFYIPHEGWNFHTGRMAREGDYIRLYVDGVKKAESYAPLGTWDIDPKKWTFFNNITITYGRFGGEVDYLKYDFTGRTPAVTGALTGAFETPFIPLPELSGVRNFSPVAQSNAGGIAHEYTTDGLDWRDVSRLDLAAMADRRIKFRTTLTRSTTTAESPVVDALNFDLARDVEVSTGLAGPNGGAAGMKFIASKRLIAAPLVEVTVDTASAGFAGGALNVPPSLIWRYDYTVPGGAPSGSGVVNISGSDLSGNAGADNTGRLTIDAQGPAAAADLAAVGRSTCSIDVVWTATADRGAAGAVSAYRIGYSTSARELGPEGAGYWLAAGPGDVPGSAKSYTLAGLEQGAEYYAAVWSLDTLGNVSEISNVVSTRTYGYAVSGDNVASLVSPAPGLSLTAISSGAAASGAPLFAAGRQGFEPAAGAIYDIEPSGVVFDTPAQLRFMFDPVLVDSSTVGIYYFDGTEWSSAPVSGQSVTLLADGRAYVEGYISHTSLYTVLFYRDRLAPRTALAADAARRYVAGAAVYLTGATPLYLQSVDDRMLAGDGLGLGVRRQSVNIHRLGGTAGRDLIFENPLPGPGGVFGSTFTLSLETDGQYAVSYNAKDVLGRSGTAGVSTFTVDNTAPDAAAQLAGTTGENGWHISTVTVSLSAADALSGVAGVFYRLDGADGEAFTPYAGAYPVSAEGQHALLFYAKDNLGNTGAQLSRSFWIDLTAPAVTKTITPAGNQDGWYNSAVSVAFSGSDAVSGLAYCEPAKIMLAEGRDIAVSGYCRDYAGLSSTVTASLSVDLTSPTVSAERLPAANNYGWNNTDVTAKFVCSDALSGIKLCPEGKVFIAEGAQQGIGGAAWDYADNSSAASIGGINIDKTAPVTVLSLAGGQWQDAGKIYLSPRSLLTLSAADPLSGDTASGVEAVEYRVNSWAYELYSSSFSLAEGVMNVSFRARDRAGNVEVETPAEFQVDGAAPLTTLSVSGARHDADGLVYISGGSGLTLAAADPAGNGPASGVLLTKYRIDGGNWQVCSGSITLTGEGRHTLEYYSLDRVLNAEQPKTAELAVDNTPPATAVTLGAPRFEAFGLPVLSPDAPITLAAADAASGLRSLLYETRDVGANATALRGYTGPFTLPQGTYDLRYWAVDNVGNVEQYKQVRIAVSTLQGGALQAVERLEISGAADISGAVVSNGAVSAGGNARILGDVTASEITLSGKAQITGQQHSGAATLEPAPLELTDIVKLALTTNNNNLIAAKYLSGGRLVVSSKDTITLSTGIYYFSGISLTGGASVNLGGKVDILVAGDVSLTGGASFNATGAASGLNLFLSTASSLSVAGGGSLAAYVYAPYAQLKLAGNALLGGHYFVKSAVISGTGNIIQAGETLPQTTTTTGDSGIKKKASAFAPESYSALSGPDPAFRLGEVYVFPNPALRGDAPVFHIETGIADSVRITVYTVSGRQAHEYALTGMPVALDDGNGLSYAYEYVWRGHIPSGVYYYHIETEKSGQKLKKTGKFAVVR